jgi:hypothetical protein
LPNHSLETLPLLGRDQSAPYFTATISSPN